VASSILTLGWGANTVREFVLSWAKDLAFGLALEKTQPNKCLRVYYEDVITKPRETIAKVCQFCGITYQESMLNGEAFKVPKYTRKQHALVGQYPDSKKMTSWQSKLLPWQIYEIENHLGDLMSLLGYKKFLESIPPRPSRFKKLAHKIFSIPKFLFKRKCNELRKIYFGFFNKN
jgi:hypothetical protein